MTVTVYSARRDCLTSLEMLDYLDLIGVDYEHYVPFPELRAHMQWTQGYDAFPHVWIDEVFLGGADEFWQVIEWRAARLQQYE